MSEPRIVTPEEAYVMLKDGDHDLVLTVDWAYTVANEPDRIRAAVVAELRRMSDRCSDEADDFYGPSAWRILDDRADAIERGEVSP